MTEKVKYGKYGLKRREQERGPTPVLDLTIMVKEV